ncbi:MAG: DNA primase DnaG [Haloarculaceae archaeon]
MQESPKYLVHAAFRASGVVERSDVVGAVFGQTEGLLGEGLDLRDLQESSKVGRIDVSLDTEGGRTYGTMTIASGLDRVETAILAAGLETIERVGPARARVEVERIEDAREAKRREVIDRAAELLADLEVESTSSRDLVEEVRDRVQVADIEEYEGLPAGPRVADSDAMVVVEGRADVLTLLRYGVRNAIAAEGTDVPEALADLSADRTTTAFLDGDRGGELICRELAQVADVDYVTFAPDGEAVEDLDRTAVTDALRRKVPIERILDAPAARKAFYAETAGEGAEVKEYQRGVSEEEPGEGAREAASEESDDAGPATVDTGSAESQSDGTETVEPGAVETEAAETEAAETEAVETGAVETEAVETAAAEAAPAETGSGGPAADGEEADEPAGGAVEAGGAQAPAELAAAGGGGQATVREEEPAADADTLADHVAAVIDRRSGTVRLLDGESTVLDTAPAGDAVGTVESADPAPTTVVVDAALTQALLDVGAQRGVEQVVARGEGDIVKRPTALRIRSADEF